MQKLELPRIARDPKEIEGLCGCRPVCRSRRREWQGQLLQTSAELLIDRRPKTDCQRRQPMKLHPNSPCPLFGKVHHKAIREKNTVPPEKVVKICQAPVDDTANTTYLRYAKLAKKLGAWQAVNSRCAFCSCCGCCSCARGGYALREPGAGARRCCDMRAFDARVRTDPRPMQAMYDKEQQ